MAPVVVSPVSTGRELGGFVELPYRLYAGDPDWAPPLRSDVRWMLDEKKNPFWKHARKRLFLARRDGRVVGRIAAIADDEHNRVHGDRTGFFGFFECENDADACRALFEAAEGAAREILPGCDRLRGPVNPSLNEDVGALIPSESEPGIPFLMMTYNPAYYLDLFASAGFAKEKDLVAILAPVSDHGLGRLGRIADGVRRREKGGLSVRPIRMDRFAEDLAIVKEIYNRAWEKNWGFVPMTDREFDHLAKDLKMILIPELTLIAEVKGEAVAFCITLPDANQAIKTANGKLTTFGLPIGLAKMLLKLKKIKTGRLAIMGIKTGFRKRGLDSVLFLDTFLAARKLGWKGGEISWTLEDNTLVNRAIEIFGARKYKTYRVYGKPMTTGEALKN